MTVRGVLLGLAATVAVFGAVAGYLLAVTGRAGLRGALAFGGIAAAVPAAGLLMYLFSPGAGDEEPGPAVTGLPHDWRGVPGRWACARCGVAYEAPEAGAGCPSGP